MTYYGFGHGVGMSQCGAVGYAQEQGMGYREILRHYYTGVSISTSGSSGAVGSLTGCTACSTGKQWKTAKRNARKTFSNHAGFGIL